MANENTNDASTMSAEDLRTNAPQLREAWSHGLSLKKYLKNKPMLDIIGDYEAKLQESNEANEARYQEGLAMWDSIIGNYADTMPVYDPFPAEFGAGQYARIAQEERQARGTMRQGMVDRGLFNTTTSLAGEVAVGEAAGRARLDLGDRIAGMEMEHDARFDTRMDQFNANRTNLQAQKVGFLERKEDNPPDFGMASSLINMYAQRPSRYRQLSSAQISKRENRLNSAMADAY